jgi:hypothetical protein
MRRCRWSLARGRRLDGGLGGRLRLGGLGLGLAVGGRGAGLAAGGTALRGLRLGGLLGANQAVALGTPADAVGLRLLDARGVRLDPDAQVLGQIEGFLVRQAELLGELVYPDLRCQSCP